jgi:hypothetical protein
VQFFPYPELEIKKYAQGQELLIFAVFFEKLAHCAATTNQFILTQSKNLYMPVVRHKNNLFIKRLFFRYILHFLK